MKDPILVVLAAGMGSRYGGLKQIDPVGMHGEPIIDYSIYDAYRAGFRRVVFIIRREIQADFEEVIGNRISKVMDVKYAFQSIYDLPEGFSLPEGRTKPWGTTHAILSAGELLDAPFAIINADDYYGPEAYRLIYRFLTNMPSGEKHACAAIGYVLKNTLTEHGSVARGICRMEQGMLTGVAERTCIEKHGDVIEYTEDGGVSWNALPENSIVSMNFWGFGPELLAELRERFTAFLGRAMEENPLKAEYYLSAVVDDMLRAKTADVTVMLSSDRWYGVTYKEDKPSVEQAIRRMIVAEQYPEHLWGGSIV